MICGYYFRFRNSFLFLKVISGHLGWVRCIAVEPGNQWFVTGSADRTIKVRGWMELLAKEALEVLVFQYLKTSITLGKKKVSVGIDRMLCTELQNIFLLLQSQKWKKICGVSLILESSFVVC